MSKYLLEIGVEELPYKFIPMAVSQLENGFKSFFEENNIIAKYDVREDIAYYNESEPDIEKLKQAKVEGEKQRTKNDLFYLSLAIGIRDLVS